jgi:hypothetical protein
LVALGVAEPVVIAAPAAAVIAVAVAAIPVEAAGVVVSGAAAALGVEISLDPFDFFGATPGEADQLIPPDWNAGPSQGAGGAIWANPATKGAEQLRYQPGNATDENPMKRGPYFKYSSSRGTKWGPIPAAGNQFVS